MANARGSGSGNNCAMLERGYIELIGIVDPNYLGRLRDDLARYEGLHIVAFGTRNSEATIGRCAAQVSPARLPGSSSGRSSIAGKTEIARFEIIDFGDVLPEIYSFAIRHVTPDALWKPELLRHPNGAKSLEVHNGGRCRCR